MELDEYIDRCIVKVDVIYYYSILHMIYTIYNIIYDTILCVYVCISIDIVY